MRYEGFKREVLNAPNLITLGRLLLIPPVLVLIHPTDPFANAIASLLFAVAAALDILDGWLARRQGLVTVFGKFVDPLADKIMVTAVLVYLVWVLFVPPWVVVVMIGRDFYISGLRSVASAEGIVIAAGEGGKIKTVFQAIGICCVLVRYTYRMPLTGQMLDFHWLGMLFLYGSVILSLTSAVQYTLEFRRALQGSPRD